MSNHMSKAWRIAHGFHCTVLQQLFMQSQSLILTCSLCRKHGSSLGRGQTKQSVTLLLDLDIERDVSQLGHSFQIWQLNDASTLDDDCTDLHHKGH